MRIAIDYFLYKYPQQLSSPREGVVVDRREFSFVADIANHAIRTVSPFGRVTTMAWNGIAGF